MKNMKKVLVLLLAVLILATSVISSFAEVTPEVTKAKAGETVEIVFSYDDIPGISGTFEFTNSALVKGYEITSAPKAAANGTSYAWFAGNGAATGVKITVKVVIADTVQPGDKCDVIFTYELSDKDGKLPATPDYKVDTATIEIIDSSVSIDYTGLDEQITRYGNLIKDQYTVDSWAVAEAAYEEAMKVRNQSPVTQTEVDHAADALKKAIDNLVPVPSVDYSRLEKLIADAKSISSLFAEYTEDSWNALEVALAAGEAALNSDSQKVVDEAADNLDAALSGLKRLDYKKLNEQIDAANALKKEDYTADSWTKLEKALADAVTAKTSRVQKVIDDAADALEAAIKALVPVSVPSVDYTELNKQIEIAQGLNKDEYTADSWAKLEKALADAIAARESKVQQEVNDAAKALADAIAALEKKPVVIPVDYTKLEDAIEKALSLKEEDYTPNSWANLQKALADAIAARKSNVQSEVDAAMKALNAAIDALVPATSDSVVSHLWIALAACVVVLLGVLALRFRKRTSER